jgi:hypothetical protein
MASARQLAENGARELIQDQRETGAATGRMILQRSGSPALRSPS